MEMRYAHRNDVLRQLHLDPETPEHEAAIERVERLETGLCETFDQQVGTSFGVYPAPETRRVFVNNDATRIPLQHGLRSVDVVLVHGDPLDDDAYSLALIDRDGIAWAIDLDQATYWPVGYGSVTFWITGVWGDQSQEDVPADVREALTFIVVDEYRTRNASPAGEIGPDGMTIPTRNPWTYRLVVSAIERHRAKAVVL